MVIVPSAPFIFILACEIMEQSPRVLVGGASESVELPHFVIGILRVNVLINVVG